MPIVEHFKINNIIYDIQSQSTYELPIATSSTLGGVKIGNGLSIDNNGTISVTTNNLTLGNFAEANYTISDVDLTDGTSPLATGEFYFYYES